MATLLTKIQIKRDTYENLKDVQLAAGEPAIAIMPNPGSPEDPGHLQFAIGDGVKTFKDLSLKIKDGVTNLTGTGRVNQIAVFTDNGGNDIVGSLAVVDKDGNFLTPGQIQTTILNKAPLIVSSKVLVSNLNADLLDGKEGADYFSEDWLGFTENASAGNFPLRKDANNKLYVNVANAVSNKTITFKGADISVNSKTSDSFTLNQSTDKEMVISITKDPKGNRAINSIVSAVASGTLQSNNYQVSYVKSSDQSLQVGTTLMYDQIDEALKFIF